MAGGFSDMTNDVFAGAFVEASYMRVFVFLLSNLWGNAVAEPFFKTFNRELVNGRRCRSKDEARQEVLKYIEPYRNRQRLHSRNGYMAPCYLGRDAA